MTAVLRLHEVTDQLLAIGDTLLENGGELTPELEQQLAQVEGAFEEKIERILLYAINLAASGDAAFAEAKRLTQLGSSRSRAAERLREYVKGEMQRVGRTKIATDRIVTWIQKNGRPSIAWTRPVAELPTQLIRIRHELDGEAAYLAWKSGEPLPPGFTVEQGTHLRVK